MRRDLLLRRPSPRVRARARRRPNRLADRDRPDRDRPSGSASRTRGNLTSAPTHSPRTRPRVRPSAFVSAVAVASSSVRDSTISASATRSRTSTSARNPSSSSSLARARNSVAFRPAPVLGDVRDDPSASSLIRARSSHALASASRLSRSPAMITLDANADVPSSIPSARPSRREDATFRDRLERAGEPMPRGSTTIRLPRRSAIVAGEAARSRRRLAVSAPRTRTRQPPTTIPRRRVSRRLADASTRRPSRVVASPRRRRATRPSLFVSGRQTNLGVSRRDASRRLRRRRARETAPRAQAVKRRKSSRRALHRLRQRRARLASRQPLRAFFTERTTFAERASRRASDPRAARERDGARFAREKSAKDRVPRDVFRATSSRDGVLRETSPRRERSRGDSTPPRASRLRERASPRRDDAAPLDARHAETRDASPSRESRDIVRVARRPRVGDGTPRESRDAKNRESSMRVRARVPRGRLRRGPRRLARLVGVTRVSRFLLDARGGAPRAEEARAGFSPRVSRVDVGDVSPRRGSKRVATFRGGFASRASRGGPRVPRRYRLAREPSRNARRAGETREDERGVESRAVRAFDVGDARRGGGAVRGELARRHGGGSRRVRRCVVGASAESGAVPFEERARAAREEVRARESRGDVADSTVVRAGESRVGFGEGRGVSRRRVGGRGTTRRTSRRGRRGRGRRRDRFWRRPRRGEPRGGRRRAPWRARRVSNARRRRDARRPAREGGSRGTRGRARGARPPRTRASLRARIDAEALASARASVARLVNAADVPDSVAIVVVAGAREATRTPTRRATRDDPPGPKTTRRTAKTTPREVPRATTRPRAPCPLRVPPFSVAANRAIAPP